MTRHLLPESSASRVGPLASRGLRAQVAARPELDDRPVLIPAVRAPISRQFPPAAFDPTPPTSPLTLPLDRPVVAGPPPRRRLLLPLVLTLAVLGVAVLYALPIWAAIP